MAWEAIAIAVGRVALLITILLDMLSRAFGLQSVGMWVKSEYSQVAATFLIIAFAVVMQNVGRLAVGEIATQVAQFSGNVDLTNAYTYAASLPTGGTPTAIAKAYIEAVVECERNVYLIVYWINVYVETFSKVSFDVAHLEVLGAGIALTGWVTLFHYILNNIVYLVLYHYIQYNLLNLSEYTMLQVFLPIGLALRAFAPTRGAGGLVTAFAIGFAFVFPMTYVIIVALMPSAGSVCTQVKVQAQPTNLPFGNEDPCFNNAGGIIEGYFKLATKLGLLAGIVDNLKSTVNILFRQAIFYPLAALIVTFTFIRQTGSLFGADLAEIGRGLIKIL